MYRSALSSKYTVTFTLVLMIADETAHGSKRVVLEKHFTSFVKLILFKGGYIMALHVMDEANRCLQCKVPQCQKGCPINTNIPMAIRLLKDVVL